MSVEYIFEEGQRVFIPSAGKYGEIVVMVPGNGKTGEEWYYVKFDDGREERFQRNDIEDPN